jgi:WhiB family redox-sensing transcriptional regulator
MSMSIAAARPVRDRRPDWRDHAACRDADPELFFPDGDIRSARAQVNTAKPICRHCPVRATCLRWALATGQQAGIWGGLTEDERRRDCTAAAAAFHQPRTHQARNVMTGALHEWPRPAAR